MVNLKVDQKPLAKTSLGSTHDSPKPPSTLQSQDSRWELLICHLLLYQGTTLFTFTAALSLCVKLSRDTVTPFLVSVFFQFSLSMI